jgi:protoporphyrinogen oxidase
MEFAQVVIVGGGVAGLAAAKTLGSDVSYVLVEAQNYLGGRILTVDAGNVLRKIVRLF